MRKKRPTSSAPDKAGRPEPTQQGLPLDYSESGLPVKLGPEPLIKRLKYPLWTENKARLIEHYLYYFVLITRHGTYIDGFAGPQRPENPDMWAAKLVLETKPAWLRHFHLYDNDPRQFEHLALLKDTQVLENKRKINIYCGDFNALVHDLLSADSIGPREATFCLLDQRTFECHWNTVKTLAKHKGGSDHKIEIFYFFGIGWFRRAIAALKNDDALKSWWGRDDWEDLRTMRPQSILDELVSRFRAELGYASVKSWPIFEYKDSKAIMYYMIHATDHRIAPGLMSRAYARAVGPRETPEQFLLEFQQQTPCP